MYYVSWLACDLYFVLDTLLGDSFLTIFWPNQCGLRLVRLTFVSYTQPYDFQSFW